MNTKLEQQYEKETLKLINVVQRKLRRVFNMTVFKKSKEQKMLLNDVTLMHIDLLHLLSTTNFKTKKEYFDLINSFLELEYEAYNYSHRPMYKIGKLGYIIKLILIKHGLLEIEDNLKVE